MLDKIRNRNNYNYDIIIMCTPDVLEGDNGKFISNFVDYIIIVPYLLYNTFIPDFVITTKPHYSKVWFKFHIYRLINYQKVCLLDGDYLVSGNSDFPNIFNEETPIDYLRNSW